MQSNSQSNWYRQALIAERIRYASTLVDDELIKEAGMGKDIGEGLAALIAAVGLLLGGYALNEAAHMTRTNPKQVEQAAKNPKIVEKAKQLAKDKPLPQGDLLAKPVVSPNIPVAPPPAQVKKESPSRTSHPVVEFAKKLVDKGFRVGSHANFDLDTGYHPEGKQRIGTHSPNSYHYKGVALDISAKGRSAAEMTQIFNDLKANWQNYGIKELIWGGSGGGFVKERNGKQVSIHNNKIMRQHANHIHVAWGGASGGEQMASTETPSEEGGASLPQGRNPSPYEITPEVKTKTVEVLNRAADKYNLGQEARKMMFITRSIENGGPGLEMGIGDGQPNHEARRFGALAAKGCKMSPTGKYIVVDMEAFERSLTVQAEWAAGTIAKRFSQDQSKPLDKRVEAFAQRYCNTNWKNWKSMAMSMWESVFDRFTVA